MIQLIGRFLRSRRGNFAVMFTFAFPAIIAGVALAVDISNTLRVRTDLQNANDAAVLFAARYYIVNKRLPSTADVQGFLDANSSFTITNPHLTYIKASDEIRLTSHTRLNTYLMGYFNRRNNEYDSESRATIGVNGWLEFALALDTTGSMSVGSKMQDLKTAAKNFVNLLYDVRDRGGDIKGSIVPFAAYVNVGLGQKGQPWLDVPPDIDTRRMEQQCSTTTPVVGQTNCQQSCWPAQTINHPATPGSCSTNDGVQTCSPGSAAWTETRPAGCGQSCDNVYGTPVTTCQMVQVGQLITWEGCVGSRNYPLNVQDTNYAQKVPGLLQVSCSKELQPLTDARGQLISKINQLSPSGETYIPAGVEWGTRLLTQWAPFAEGRAVRPDKNDRKVLVVMTDGINTLSPNGAYHTGTNQSQANQYTAEACADAKSRNIEIFTVSFGSGVTNTVRDLLKQCASDTDHYYHASNGNALVSAFEDIAENLLTVRLTM